MGVKIKLTLPCDNQKPTTTKDKMVRINKKGKIFIIALAVVFTAVSGFIIEYYDGRTFKEEVVTESISNGYYSDAPSEIDGKININSATAEELDLLNGIGEALAGRIIKYREENGPFEQTEQIMRVNGIGEKLYENIKDHICVY